MCIHDVYILGESDSFEIKSREEVTANLELEKVPPCYHTVFTGKVLCRNWPIKNATVMVLDENCSPLYSSITNDKGIFKFRNIIKPGEYKVIASGVGYNTTEITTVFIQENEITKMIFSLKKSPAFVNGLIYGKVLESGSGEPIEDAEIYLKSIGCDKTLYKTMSNHNGQYLIYNIIPNHYEMVVQKQSYRVTEPLLLKIERYSQVCLYFDLIENPYECKNTISGMITHDNIPLSKVAVFLYLIDTGENETIVQIQETNEDGLFLFSSVESGHYLVKGKLQNNVVYENSFDIE
ncbi:carboxypeptidase regulatory-like domain-containing protein [Anaerotignum sp.]|uniref:carboxypeptidase regulatory-like domain-containing protein n=1 Tax=Anaerotignum sp. TaxID=2039241 RepID=UPI00271494C0|nr:carboxypeptidase regulatory-like domain-containing protein [Anaerotignum sp.]